MREKKTGIDDGWRIPEELWSRIQPLLPPRPRVGRPRRDDRQMMDGIFYVLRAGCQWKALPGEFGPASAAHDRFQFWREAGVFRRLWQAGLVEYDAGGGIEWEWQAMDGQ